MKWLHTWVFASKRNRFHPKALEPIGLLAAAAIVFLLPLTYNITTARTFQVLGYATDISADGLNAATNSQRANNGMAGLSINGQLQQAAQNKAAHMFAHNYWAHTAPDGTTPWSFVTNAGYAYSLVGENLAKNFTTSNGVVNAWMNSSGHRANVLNAGFQQVGYGIANGTLQGDEVTLVVALYASPVQAAAPAASTPAPAAPAPQASPAPTTPTPQPAAQATAEPSQPPATTEPQASAPQATPSKQTEQPVASAPDSTPQAQNSTASTETHPAVLAMQRFAPVQAYTSLNWAQKASLFVLVALGLLFTLKHTVIWRHSKRGVRQVWLRAHPLAQASVLGVAVFVTLITGTGVIL